MFVGMLYGTGYTDVYPIVTSSELATKFQTGGFACSVKAKWTVLPDIILNFELDSDSLWNRFLMMLRRGATPTSKRLVLVIQRTLLVLRQIGEVVVELSLLLLRSVLSKRKRQIEYRMFSSSISMFAGVRKVRRNKDSEVFKLSFPL